MTTFSRADYETLLYTLAEQYRAVASSTLRLYPNSKTTALVRGTVYFKNGLELYISEYLDLTDGEILGYSYTILYNGEKLRWYDPQPHPEIKSLQATFPHHRHESPNIKQNRQPAPGITFQAPNLERLIQDCIELGESLQN
jgi:hypothetical protein